MLRGFPNINFNVSLWPMAWVSLKSGST